MRSPHLLSVIPLSWLLVSTLFGTPLAYANDQGKTAERWVVLGGDVAATLALLASDINVVARDDTVLYPAEMAALPSVGYLRQLSAESVLQMHPDHVLASEHAGPAEVLEQLTAAGVELALIKAPATLASIPAKVRAVAQHTGDDESGEQLAQRLAEQLQQLADLPALPQAKAMFILQHSGLTPRVAGHHTAAHTALEAVGLENAFATMQGYQSVSAEALVQAAPDLVIISARGLQAMGGQDTLWQFPGMALTAAGNAKRLVVIDDQALLGFGPRAPDQLFALRRDVADLLGVPAPSTDQATP